VRVGFQLTKHVRDRHMVTLLETYFGCGKYYLSKDRRQSAVGSRQSAWRL